MKTYEVLVAELTDAYKNNPSARGLKMYNMQPSGNIFADFYKFTDSQGGGKSCDKNDPYLKNGHWPPSPDKDGKLYHTVRDIAWDTFATTCPTLKVSDFYEMSDKTREYVVSWFVKRGQLTQSEAINYLLSYCIWGSGNALGELRTYKSWYKSAITEDIDKLGEDVVFVRLCDIRKYRTTSASFPGWVGGILCFWNVFRHYCN